MKHLLVTGANGQLGQAIRVLAESHPTYRFYFTDIETLDICNKEAVTSFIQSNRINYILNCAAYTAVDKAEQEEDKATLVNKEAVRILGEAAHLAGAKMIHISTDYVFNGMGCFPYTENDIPAPVSAYGRTKLAGERVLQDVCPAAVIIRTSWLYSEFGNNFVKTMIRLGKEREKLSVVFDQVGTPTYAGDLAKAMLAVVDSDQSNGFTPGVYHYSNEGVCSWYDFALKIMLLSGANCQVEPIETKDYPTPTERPAFSVLNKAKIKKRYTITIPHWEESLRKVIDKLTING